MMIFMAWEPFQFSAADFISGLLGVREGKTGCAIKCQAWRHEHSSRNGTGCAFLRHL